MLITGGSNLETLHFTDVPTEAKVAQGLLKVAQLLVVHPRSDPRSSDFQMRAFTLTFGITIVGWGRCLSIWKNPRLTSASESSLPWPASPKASKKTFEASEADTDPKKKLRMKFNKMICKERSSRPRKERVWDSRAAVALEKKTILQTYFPAE